jgi:hypothetical protein
MVHLVRPIVTNDIMFPVRRLKAHEVLKALHESPRFVFRGDRTCCSTTWPE